MIGLTDDKAQRKGFTPQVTTDVLIGVKDIRDAEYTTYFTLILKNVLVYGMRVVSTQSGELFISWPQRKGSDGKYYAHVWGKIEKEVQDTIIEAIRNCVRTKKEEYYFVQAFE